jgi:hypothetical protein
MDKRLQLCERDGECKMTINSYPVEVIDLAISVPLSIDSVMYIYILWFRNIEHTKKAIEYFLITGRVIGPGNMEAAKFI